jgi:rhamnosyltransferase
LAATHSSPPTTGVLLGTLADTIRDAKWCLKNHQLSGLPRAAITRLYQRLGRHAGYSAGRAHHSRP